MGRTILIAGFAEMSRWWANRQPPEVEVWGMNEDHLFLHRSDRWYQVHPRDFKEEVKRKAGVISHIMPDTFGRGFKHIQWLRAYDKPLYMNSAVAGPEFPTSQVYPIEAVKEAFGFAPGGYGEKRPYLTSTPAYMLAHALLEGRELPGDPVSEIRMSGIELAIGTEYFHQRPCLEFYLGIAYARGVKITFAPSGCSLLQAPVYAVEAPIPIPSDYTAEPVELRDRSNVATVQVAAQSDGRAKE